MKPIKLQNIRPGQIIVKANISSNSYRIRGKHGDLLFLDIFVSGKWHTLEDPVRFESCSWVRVPKKFYS